MGLPGGWPAPSTKIMLASCGCCAPAFRTRGGADGGHRCAEKWPWWWSLLLLEGLGQLSLLPDFLPGPGVHQQLAAE